MPTYAIDVEVLVMTISDDFGAWEPVRSAHRARVKTPRHRRVASNPDLMGACETISHLANYGKRLPGLLEKICVHFLCARTSACGATVVSYFGTLTLTAHSRCNAVGSDRLAKPPDIPRTSPSRVPTALLPAGPIRPRALAMLRAMSRRGSAEAWMRLPVYAAPILGSSDRRKPLPRIKSRKT